MEWILNNWYLIIAAIAVISGVTITIITYAGLPTNKQLEKVKEWLLFAVSEAEKELGSGTGQLKLSMVYDMFVVRFSWLAKVISFKTFSLLVDEALDKMRILLQTNEAINTVIIGKSKGVE